MTSLFLSKAKWLKFNENENSYKIRQKTDEKTKFRLIPDLEKIDSEEIELTLNILDYD